MLGAACKRDVSDIHESPVLDIIHLLEEKGADVTYYSPAEIIGEFTYGVVFWKRCVNAMRFEAARILTPRLQYLCDSWFVSDTALKVAGEKVTMSEKISEAAIDYGMARTSLQKPLILERDGQPLAVLISFEEYRRLQSIAADEITRQQIAWRELDEFLSGIHRHPTSYSYAQMETEITAAREEVKENRRGSRRSH